MKTIECKKKTLSANVLETFFSMKRGFFQGIGANAILLGLVSFINDVSSDIQNKVGHEDECRVSILG